MSSISNDIQFKRLLNLLCSTISGRPQDVSLFDGMSQDDWQQLLDISMRHGVAALCFDAIENGSSRPDIDVLVEWFGQTSFVEYQYENHLSLAKTLTSEWSSSGIRTMVFKGLAHSRYYPTPSHREFCDFDCYQFGAIDKGNRVALQMNAKVDDGWYKHTKIKYKELTVENHRYFTATRSNKEAKALNEHMVRILGDGSCLTRLDGTDILLPPLMEEGLFMLHHSMRHFLEEGVSLRHFCDWACWIKVNQRRIIWDSFYSQCKEYRLDGFVDVLNEIASSYLGIELCFESVNDEKNRALADKVIANSISVGTSIHNKGKGRWDDRINLVKNAIIYSWKYREIAHYSVAGYLWNYVKGFVRRDEED